MDHEINNDTRFSVSSSMSSYSASSILLVLPSASLCYTLEWQITFSQELRWGQNKLIATQCSEWDKRVSTKDTNRNNLKQHETNEWKKYRSYSLVTKRVMGGGGGERGKKNINFPLKDSNLRPSDFMIWSFFKLSRQWAMKYSGYIKDHPPYCWDHQCRTFHVLKYIMKETKFKTPPWQKKKSISNRGPKKITHIRQIRQLDINADM